MEPPRCGSIAHFLAVRIRARFNIVAGYVQGRAGIDPDSRAGQDGDSRASQAPQPLQSSSRYIFTTLAKFIMHRELQAGAALQA